MEVCIYAEIDLLLGSSFFTPSRPLRPLPVAAPLSLVPLYIYLKKTHWGREPSLALVWLRPCSYAFGYFSATSSLNQNPNPTVPTTAFKIGDDHTRFGSPCAEPLQPDRVRRTILDSIFNGTSPFENFPPPHAASLLSPKKIKGWGSYGVVFENLIKRVQPNTIIEVGTFLGASAIHMAGLATRFGLNRTQILCLDDFRGWPGFRDRVKDIPLLNGDVLLMYQFMQNVVSSNATGSILPVPFSTGSGLQRLCELGVYADLIEVDAGHDFHSAWADVNRAYKLLRPGGVLFGHDYFTAYDNRGVRRAVNLFARVNGLKIRTDGQHWVIDSVSG